MGLHAGAPGHVSTSGSSPDHYLPEWASPTKGRKIQKYGRRDLHESQGLNPSPLLAGLLMSAGMPVQKRVSPNGLSPPKAKRGRSRWQVVEPFTASGVRVDRAVLRARISWGQTGWGRESSSSNNRHDNNFGKLAQRRVDDHKNFAGAMRPAGERGPTTRSWPHDRRHRADATGVVPSSFKGGRSDRGAEHGQPLFRDAAPWGHKAICRAWRDPRDHRRNRGRMATAGAVRTAWRRRYSISRRSGESAARAALDPTKASCRPISATRAGVRSSSF